MNLRMPVFEVKMNSPMPQQRMRTPGRRKENRDGAEEWSIGMAHRMGHRMLQARMWVVRVARRWRVARSLCHHLSRLTRNHGVAPHPYSTWNNESWYSICKARWKIRSTMTYSCTNASTCCMRHIPMHQLGKNVQRAQGLLSCRLVMYLTTTIPMM